MDRAADEQLPVLEHARGSGCKKGLLVELLRLREVLSVLRAALDSNRFY